MYKNLGKNEKAVTHLVSYTGKHYVVSYNEFTNIYTLYKLDTKTNSLEKIKSKQTPLDYDKYVYSEGKPPKLKDYVEEDYSDTLVYSSTWTTPSNNLVETKKDVPETDNKKSGKSEKPKKPKSETKSKSKPQTRKKMI